MSTPIRFVRRIGRLPAAERRDRLNTYSTKVLGSVCSHFGIVAKTKTEMVNALTKEAQKTK